jgi:dipeptidase E
MTELYLASKASNVFQDILKRLNKKAIKCKVLFISTASNVCEDKEFINKDFQVLKNAGFKVINLDIAKEKKSEITRLFNNSDIVFFAGGNTFYLMQEIRKKRILGFIRNKIKQDLSYIGSSAGAAIVCPTIAYVKDIDDLKKAPNLTSFNGLNSIRALIVPHKNDLYIKSKINSIKKKFPRYEIICLEDDEYVEIKNGILTKREIL